MMINGHNHSDFSENMQRCHDYIKALEEERCKIQVFQRELPLCLELVTQAIETCKRQLSGTTTEYSEQTSSDEVPVLEEFIPIKRASSDSDGEEHESKKSKIRESSGFSNENNMKKSDWLRSVQLWNQTPDPPSKDDSAGKFTASESEVKRDGAGAFHPFKKEGGADKAPAQAAVQPASTSSTAEDGGGKKECERKARRCWSPELHRRFLQALQQLGGPHVATPKQIKELMKVDGLTNDEVKSHLQKYRLHTRRPSPSTTENINAQAPQFVVVGGLWMSPEYSSIATATASVEAPVGGATSEGTYARIAASSPPTFQETPRHVKPSSQSNDGCSYSKGGAQSCSAATSSSTHTTTAVSPAC